MTRENYHLSDLDPLLSKDNITENDLLQLPDLFIEETKKLSEQNPSHSRTRKSIHHSNR